MCPPPEIEYSKLYPVFPEVEGMENFVGSRSSIAYMQERVVISEAEQSQNVPQPELMMMQTWSTELAETNTFRGIRVLAVSGRGWEELVETLNPSIGVFKWSDDGIVYTMKMYFNFQMFLDGTFNTQQN